jgi:hypothetical protein
MKLNPLDPYDFRQRFASGGKLPSHGPKPAAPKKAPRLQAVEAKIRREELFPSRYARGGSVAYGLSGSVDSQTRPTKHPVGKGDIRRTGAGQDPWSAAHKVK